MFERTSTHVCAYTHQENSRDNELVQLMDWIRNQPGTGLTLVGPVTDSYTHSDAATELVNAGIAYQSLRQLKSGTRSSNSMQRVLALWPSTELLNFIEDNLTDLKALGVLTFSFKDVEIWRRARQAVDVLGIADNDEIRSMPSELLGALKSLTLMVNLSTGLIHPNDHDAAVLTFRRLSESRISYEGDEVQIWAMANGWASRDASELGTLARDIASGRSRQLKSRTEPYKAKMLDYWREQAAE